MTPPPAGTVAARRAAARTAPARRRAPARRSSGPLKARAAASVATRVATRIPRRVSGPARARTAPQPLGVRLAAFATTLPDRSIVDRLVRGQGWIALVGTLLIGLVAMQVSLLKLNAGIGSSVERAAALERSNGELRAQVSQLESGERIQDKAASLGMIMPPAGQISYLRAGRGSTAGAAAEALRQQSFNDPSKAQPLPGEGDGQSDPWGNVNQTSADSTSEDSTSSDSMSSDSTSGDSTSGDSSSGDSSSSDSSSTDSSSTSSDSSSSDSGSTDTSSTDTSGDATTASAGGTSSG
jgi:hypothetical protein